MSESTATPAAPAHAPLSRGAAYGVFAVLVLIWGLNWPIMKMVVQLMPPLWFVVARLALGALCLFALLAATGRFTLEAVPGGTSAPVGGAPASAATA